MRGPSWLEQPHAITVADIAAGCAALDYGYATWFSHQVDEVIARDKEDDLAGGVKSCSATALGYRGMLSFWLEAPTACALIRNSPALQAR